MSVDREGETSDDEQHAGEAEEEIETDIGRAVATRAKRPVRKTIGDDEEDEKDSDGRNIQRALTLLMTDSSHPLAESSGERSSREPRLGAVAAE